MAICWLTAIMQRWSSVLLEKSDPADTLDIVAFFRFNQHQWWERANGVWLSCSQAEFDLL
jgi:hypothetical protein